MISRKFFLLFVATLCVLFLLLQSVEGASGKPPKNTEQCKNKVYSWNSSQRKNSADKPPINPTYCEGIKLKRGKNCYKSDGKNWIPVTDAKECKGVKSWVNYVNWKGDNARKGIRSPFARPKNYFKLGGWDVNDNKGEKYYDYLTNGGQTWEDVDTADACATACNNKGGDDCAGFGITKTDVTDGKYKCRLFNWNIVNGVKGGDPKTYTNTMKKNSNVNVYLRQSAIKNKSNAGPAPVPAGSTVNAAPVPSTNTDCSATVYEDRKYAPEVTSFKLECDKEYDADTDTGTDIDQFKIQFSSNEDLEGNKKKLNAYKITSIRIPLNHVVTATKVDSTTARETRTFEGNQDELTGGWNDRIVKIKVSKKA